MDPAKTITDPLLSKSNPNPNPKGGFRIIPFILVNEALERAASFGLTPNMILYLTREYRLGTAQAAQIVFFWSSLSFFTPIIGAFLADSYLGRYRMIALGSLANLLGMVLLWLTTAIPEARPLRCAKSNDNMCESATTLQLLLLFSSFAVMSIGGGGIRSCCLAFGVDQLDQKNNLKKTGALESFFSWYYVTCTMSVFFAITFIVYIQDAFGWKVGFGIPVVLMFLSTMSFFLATPFYVKSKTNPSLLTGFAQVIVASFKNRRIKLPSPHEAQAMYYHKGTTHTRPTEKLRLLNKACVIKNPDEDLTRDGKASDPWSLTTVEQVEELKAVMKVFTIWSTGIIMSISVSQSSLLVIQASTMDRHITSKFEIHPGSFNTFMVLSLTLCVTLYDCVLVPLASKLNGKPTRLSMKQRMGIGLLFSALSMPAIATIESFRREMAIKEGSLDDPSAVVPMSAMWLLPYLVLSGIAEAFNAIGQNEFYYRELPKSMSSIATTFFGLAFSVGNLAASFVMRTVDGLTGRGGESWVSSNINKGHYDYYYWVLASLSFANLVYYLVCSKAYGACRSESGIDVGPEEESKD